MLQAVGSYVYKRAMDQDPVTSPTDGLPNWFWLVLIADLIVLFPLVLLSEYSLKEAIPIFAIIEDENPPAYEPVALSDDAPASDDSVRKPPGAPSAVSSSIRGTARLLRAHGGWRALFRGSSVWVIQLFATNFLVGIFMGVLGTGSTPIATLLASLSLVQLSTVWVHVVISKQSPTRFWSRMPTFRRAFDATWRPTVLYWAVCELARWAPMLLSVVMDIPGFLDPMTQGEGEDVQPVDAWKALVVFLVTMAVGLFLVVPAHIILVRVQASLLPEDDDTIIPFDRTFEGRVEPAVVGGRGFATPADAWATFSRAAWKRLLFLYVKIFTVVAVGATLVAGVVFAEFTIIAAMVDAESGSGDL